MHRIPVRNRILSFLLAALMLLGVLPAAIIATANPLTLTLTVEGQPVTELQFYEDEKILLTAQGAPEGAQWQWQVRHPAAEDLWVNIQDASQPELGITFALVKNVLSPDGTAAIRCRATAEEGTFCSDPLTVTPQARPEPTVVDVPGETSPKQVVQEIVGTLRAVLSGAAPVPDAQDFAAFARGLLTGEGATEETQAPDAAQTDDAAPEFVTVSIQYYRYNYQVDENGNFVTDSNGNYVLETEGEMVFNPYTATLPYGESLSTTVPNPAIVGYDAYLNTVENSTICTEVAIDLENIQSDVTYTVKYAPALVDYAVRYYKQNIYDDLYVEDTALARDLQGYTGTRPPDSDLKQTIYGFEPLYYQPDSIAADGSTVFEVYYERSYYLMEFDCTGGYGTDTIYARYGSYVSVPDPIRAGYIFGGWDFSATEESGTWEDCADQTADALPDTVPCYSSAYQALWNTTNTTYTVVYWAQNPDPDANGTYGYSYWGSQNLGGTSGDVTTAANYRTAPTTLTDTVYFTYNNVKTLAEEAGNPDYDAAKNGVIIQGDGSTVLNVYFDRKEYDLRFYYAMSQGNTYRIVGGSTYYFGKDASGKVADTNNVVQLLDYAFVSHKDQTGITLDVPELNEKGRLRNYKDGETTSGTRTYHYISFSAKYGADISDMWPCDVFNSVTMAKGSSNASWKNNEAVVSGWNGEHNVRYTQTNSNQTIKGVYEKLDQNLLYDLSKFSDSQTVSYLCFWENGANVAWSTPGLFRYHIYLEPYAGQDLTGKETRTFSGKTYYRETFYDTCDNSKPEDQTQPSLTGFTKRGYQSVQLTDFDNTLYSKAYDMYFFYDRNLRPVTFFSVGTEKTIANVPYDYPFADLKLTGGSPASSYVPEYPSTYEPGAYEFQGWYTTPDCFPGTQVLWESQRMPDVQSALQLYAKWAPVKHDVYFYHTYADLQTNSYWTPEKDPASPYAATDYPLKVPHNTQLPSDRNLIPTREGYNFVGWFYMDGDSKKRFDPATMQISQDLKLFAEWQSNIATQYNVTYVLGEDADIDGTTYPKGTAVAPPSADHSSAGMTKTFPAKGGTDLYLTFRRNFFPTTSSHSILMQEDASQNTFVFEYVHDPEVSYTVQYLELSTGKALADPETKTTSQAVVTEKFFPIAGYVPQSYYITRALVSDGDGSSIPAENVLTFYYVADQTHGLVSIEHYLENADSADPSDPANYTRNHAAVSQAEIGQTITAEIRAYEGYTHVPGMNTVITYEKQTDGTFLEKTETGNGLSGTVSAGGLTIRLYYQRNAYPYVIEYREYGAAEGSPALHTQTTDGTFFGTQVSHTAPESLTIGDTVYTYYDAEATEAQRTKNLTIRAFEEGSANPNVLIFYYTQKTSEVTYIPRCTDLPADTAIPFGVVSLGKETVSSPSRLTGSKATAGSGFRFVGWFDHSGQRISTEAHYKPTVLHDTPGENTYYAVFEPVLEDLVIQKTVPQNSGDHFLFRIQGTNVLGQTVDMTVAIQGSGSITVSDLCCGTYTVTELTGWSWTYEAESPVSRSVTLSNQDDITSNTAAFTNQTKPVDWLHGETGKENQFTIP